MARYKKGQSGNPGGRPKENPELRELAREYTEEALVRLAFWMRSDEPRASVTAAKEILDRGYGKPIQAIDATGIDTESLIPSDMLTVEAARRLLFILNGANELKH